MIHLKDGETLLEPWAEVAIDQIDAGMFSGDTFHSRGAINRMRYMLKRWERGLKEAESTVKYMERLERAEMKRAAQEKK
jgi:hypothetical protein